MKIYFLLPILVFLLAACINLHVHFPEASGKAAAPSAAQEAAGATQ